ncbi:MAG: TIR domain-containing protein [Nitrospirae bacterium]|nr:TIR domain-containing protein [Nitrospirota bacterium]
MADIHGKPTVFISYSHKDEAWKDRFKPHLKMLEQLDQLVIWDDRKIDAGDTWYPELKEAMDSASVAVCLISPDYLSSDFCVKEEVPYLLEKREEGALSVIPILIRPCYYKAVSWLKAIQMLPDDDKSVSANYKDDWDTPFEKAAELIFKKLYPPILKQVSTGSISVSRAGVSPVSRGISRIGIEQKITEIIIGPAVKVDIDRLPVTGAELFGRQKELELLDNAWNEGKLNAVSFVAWGGVGKSTLINKWLETMKVDNYRGAQRVFGWSFYSQGTSEKATSADLFIKDALEWFGDQNPNEGSPWDKGQRLADLVKKEKTLLILDGIEPLQAAHDFENGKIKDPALSVLLGELFKENPGLLIITTREDIPELNVDGVAAIQKNLEQISPEAGRALFRTAGVRGTDKELEDASVALGNQALALRLLGSFLYGEEGHAISHAAKIPLCENIPLNEGRHPRRVIAAFENRFGNGPEVEFLRILGLFDRPAEEGAIKALLSGKTISNLTKNLRKLSSEGQKDLLTNLRDLNLIAKASRHDGGKIDSHPLLREHFGEQLKTTYPNAWREGNSRLYEYFKTQAPELPETIEEMMPLFYAIAHGCAAGKHQEVYDEIHRKRIRRGNYFIADRLGAIGYDLACLSYFFDVLWHTPSAALTGATKALLLNLAGAYLSSIGRHREAIEPLNAALDWAIAQKKWNNAVAASTNILESILSLGATERAVDHAIEGVLFADKSESIFDKIVSRSAYAHALHQTGCLSEAERIFIEAEEIQRKYQPDCPYLYAGQGFHFCSLLLEKGNYDEVLKRAGKSLELTSQGDAPIVNIALDNLSLGRGYLHKVLHERLLDYSEAVRNLNGAIEGLRKAGQQSYLVLGLLARAELYRITKAFSKARHDLDEAMTIATRGGMGLHKADCHLEYARLYLAEGDKEKAKEHLSIAKKMIGEMGYHRRDKDVKEIEEILSL